VSSSEVEIHVCDEVKNMKKDFVCNQKLLVEKMGYFAEVTTGQRLEDMDISVHCDIGIFEWLMKWVKKDSLLEEDWPQLDPQCVVPILVSAAFLQMEPLQNDCLLFCHEHMNEILRTSTNLSCLNDSILTRLAAMYTNSEVELIKDRKDKIQSRIFTKLIASLVEPDPESVRGHWSSLARVYRCGKCQQIVSPSVAPRIPCAPPLHAAAVRRLRLEPARERPRVEHQRLRRKAAQDPEDLEEGVLEAVGRRPLPLLRRLQALLPRPPDRLVPPPPGPTTVLHAGRPEGAAARGAVPLLRGASLQVPAAARLLWMPVSRTHGVRQGREGLGDSDLAGEQSATDRGGAAAVDVSGALDQTGGEGSGRRRQQEAGLQGELLVGGLPDRPPQAQAGLVDGVHDQGTGAGGAGAPGRGVQRRLYGGEFVQFLLFIIVVNYCGERGEQSAAPEAGADGRFRTCYSWYFN
jgi:hypothetical protein